MNLNAAVYIVRLQPYFWLLLLVLIITNAQEMESPIYFFPINSPATSVPSDPPSIIPSIIPSTPPSAVPSVSTFFPSDVPSVSQSMMPSARPSDTPTLIPTTVPSCFPSAVPSNFPSESPTMAPTLTCHDLRDYRSPINNLECDDHRGTDCFNWRFLGLSVDQVEQLVVSCPVSCNITCGSLERFDIELYYKIRNVDNFLGPTSVETMQRLTVEFLTNAIHDSNPESRFFVYQMELLSQQMQQKVTNRLRRIQEVTVVDLMVRSAFRGFAIGMTVNETTALLTASLASRAYTQELQASGDPAFSNASISLNVEAEPPDDGSEIPSSTHTGASGAKIATAIIVVVVAAATASAGWVVHKRRRQRIEVPDKSIDSGVASPGGSQLSPLANVLSYDSITRLVHNMSLSPRASDVSQTSVEHSSSHSSSHSKKESTVSSNDEATMSEPEEEHPFTGIIPPMIVYDNIEIIDSEKATGSEWKPNQTKNIVPTMRMEASPTLVEAISQGASSGHAHPIGEVFYSDILGQALAPSEPDSSADESSESGPSSSSPITPRKSLLLEGQGDPNQPSESRKNFLGYFSKRRRLPSEGSHQFPRDDPEGIAIDGTVEQVSSSTTLEKEGTDSEASTVLAGTQTAERSVAPFQAVDSIDLTGQSFWNRSPGRRLKRTPSNSTDESAGKGRSKSGHRRQSSKCSDSSGGSVQAAPKTDGEEIVLQAARKGKLGLTLRFTSDEGPIVHAVKDYSPLLGQILPGDRIVSVDGVDSTILSPTQAKDILELKPSAWRAPTIQLVIWRPAILPDSTQDWGSLHGDSACDESLSSKDDDKDTRSA